MTFHFLTPLWGKDYTAQYVDFFLPAQIPGLAKLTTPSIYKIITDNKEAILKSKAYQKLTQLMPVKFVDLPSINTSNYHKMSIAYEASTKLDDFKAGDSYIFMTPDSIWSDNTFTSLEKITRKGYRAVMTVGPRAAKETFIKDFYTLANPDLSIDSKKLSKLAIKHLHPVIESALFNDRTYNIHACAIYWKCDDTLITRQFVYHPLLLTPDEPELKIKSTLDYDLVPSIVSRKKIYIVTDSDELLGVDIAPTKYASDTIKEGPFTEKHVIEWYKRGWPTLFHRWLSQFPVYIHAKPLTNQQIKMGQDTKQIIDKINQKILIVLIFRRMNEFKIRCVFFARCILGFIKRHVFIKPIHILFQLRGALHLRTRFKKAVAKLRK